jgi:hypothetical protein
VCLGSHLDPKTRKVCQISQWKGSLPSPLQVVMVMAKGVPILVGLVLGLHHKDLHTLESRLSGQSPKRFKCILVCNDYYQKRMVFLLHHLKDPGDLKIQGDQGWWGGDTNKCG